MPFELSLPEPLSPVWGLGGGGRWGDTHVPEGGKPCGAQPSPQSLREGPVVPLGLKHVGLQEGDVVPNHLDEGLAERRESRGCHMGHTVLATLQQPAERPGPHLPWPCSAGTSSDTLTTTVTAPQVAWPDLYCVLSPSPHGDPSFSLYFTEEGH